MDRAIISSSTMHFCPLIWYLYNSNVIKPGNKINKYHGRWNSDMFGYSTDKAKK